MFITSYKPVLQKNRLMALEPVRDYLCEDGGDVVTSTLAAGRIFVDCVRLHEEADERMVVLCLNSSGHVTGMFEMTCGSISAIQFDIAGILRKVLMMNCVSFIMAHNHPGGSKCPSCEDLEGTERVKQAAEMLGLRLLDHFIICGPSGEYLSLREEGYLK